MFVYTCFILDDIVNDHTITEEKVTAPCQKESKTPTITVAAQTNSANVIKGFDIPQQKQETGKSHFYKVSSACELTLEKLYMLFTIYLLLKCL